MAFYINSGNDTGAILTYNTLPRYAKMNTILSCQTAEDKLNQQKQYAENVLYGKFTAAFNWWGGGKPSTTGYTGFSTTLPIKSKPIIPEGTEILEPDELMSKLNNYTSNDLNTLIQQYISNPIVNNYITGLEMMQFTNSVIDENDYNTKLTQALRLFSIIIQPEPENETMITTDASPIPYYRTLTLAIGIGQTGASTISLSSWKTPKERQIEYACSNNQGTPDYLACHCTIPSTDKEEVIKKAACTRIGPQI